MIQSVGELISSGGQSMLKMWEVRVPAGKRPLQRHSHSRFEVALILEGGGTYTTDGSPHPMQPGDVFVFAGHEFHCISEVDDRGLRLLNLHFDPAFLEPSAPHLANWCYRHAPTFLNRIPAQQAGSLQRSLLAIQEELTQKRAEFPLAIRCLVHQLMIALLREHGYREQVEELPQLSALMAVLQYIDRHFTEPLTLEGLAGQAGLTPTYFSALFKNAFHLSPWDYITTKRVEWALHLLLHEPDRHTMLDIALQSGFNNTANFNKQFKRLTGLTPTQYRNSKEQIIH